ncbi:VOC family protein [uncultured Meiothermus sp.]|jgi:glyoxalase family protein|uniref:VOC family protein n=1 Tax=uncultured Meiothermus sp. TaxID=157471 RepID=UPI0026280E82|nr:VOC family protein [uncultured Meiothermus sp.]
MRKVSGIHHITAMAGHPQRNLEFYTGVLGLRLVKVTVNFDDPETYHFYYGDGLGRPGTLLTFFPWQRALAGRAGVHQVAIISLAIPLDSLGYWMHRLMEKGIGYEGPLRRVIPGPKGLEDVKVLACKDPDGIAVELVAAPSLPAMRYWAGAPVPEEYAIRGIFAVQMWVLRTEPSVRLLEALGYQLLGQADSITYLGPPQDRSPLGRLEVRETGEFMAAKGGVGTVHHVAFAVPDAETQQALREQLQRRGVRVTAVQDRQYFRSIYFREPGGILFEIATEIPGFTRDESFENLGTGLRLPEWLEPIRTQIMHKLPPIPYASPLPVQEPEGVLVSAASSKVQDDGQDTPHPTLSKTRAESPGEQE